MVHSLPLPLKALTESDTRQSRQTLLFFISFNLTVIGITALLVRSRIIRYSHKSLLVLIVLPIL